MEYAKAQIVRSAAGRDRGELFCVLDVDGDCLLLADGKRRKTVAPKRKKAKHTQCVGAFGHPVLSRLAQGAPVSDSEIRRALAAFRAMEGMTLWQKTI